MTWSRTVIAAAIPVAAVATVAGITSYTHVYALAMRTQQGSTAAHLLPLSLDGLIVAGSAILLAGSWLGWLGVIPGVIGTLYANVVSMLPHGQLSATVASWPAISFAVSTFVLERWLRFQVNDLPAGVQNRTPAESDDEPVIAPAAPAPAAALNGHGPGAAWSQPAVSGWS